ncbi:hypothetical protein Ancab_002875 [Ancistrocladus abbreviatus]
MKKAELVVIPMPGMGHLIPANTKPIIKRVVQEQVVSSRYASTCSESPGQLAGFVVDLLCTEMIDLANELNVPSYLFFTSGAGYLNLKFHFQTLTDDHGVEVSDELKDPGTELDVPGFRNRVPASVLPSIFLEKEGFTGVRNYTRGYRETKGIIINTFMELEPHATQSLLNDAGIPPIYPVGPIVNLNPQTEDPNDGLCNARESIMRWLDDQPPSSVVFLCFGSMGSFTEEQVREVAKGLERSGHRFLWSLRRPPPSDEKYGPPQDYNDLEGALPEGFSDRTDKIGKIIGWAPQVAVLSHPAIGGFVSHCGWNSTLESL